MVKIKFCGACSGEVTGSRHLIETNRGFLLIDCGLFQGRRGESIEKNKNFLFNPKDVSSVILSHAHIDHIGALPIMTKNGFSSDIFLTSLTADLSYIMLNDSVRLMGEDVKFYNKLHRDVGDVIEPLYTEDDVKKVFNLFKKVERNNIFEPVDGIKAKFINAGHVLGSSSVLIEVNGEKILYTGDIGRRSQMLLKKPEIIQDVDWLLIETTYGDREHDDIRNIEAEFANIINNAVKEKGKVIIPSFSLERTQEIIYIIDRLKTLKKIAEIPIYVDSPMSVKITNIFNKNLDEIDFSDEFRKYNFSDKDPFGYEYIHYVSSKEDSQRINDKKGPLIIISASGMCEGGRILHHIRNSIDDERNVLLFVGYLASNTLGRRLKEGAKKVKIFGLSHDVNFQVKSLDFFSAHAGRKDLLSYVEEVNPKKGIFLVHGEENARISFKELLLNKGFSNVYAPSLSEEIELI